MLHVLESVFFAIAQTVFAWHLFSCDTHSRLVAFLFAIVAGGFWVIVIADILAFLQSRKERLP